MDPLSLLSLPSELLIEINSHMNFPDRIEFSCTCQLMHSLERETEYKIAKLPTHRRKEEKYKTISEDQILIEYHERRFIIDTTSADLEKKIQFFKHSKIEALEIKALFCPLTEHKVHTIFQTATIYTTVLYLFSDLKFCSDAFFINLTRNRSRENICLTWSISAEEIIVQVRRLAHLVPERVYLHMVKYPQSAHRGPPIYERSFLESLLPKTICILLEDVNITGPQCFEIFEIFVNSTEDSPIILKVSDEVSNSFCDLCSANSKYRIIHEDGMRQITVVSNPAIHIAIEEEANKIQILMKNSNSSKYS